MTPDSSAWLHLRGIALDAILGCRPDERTAPRPVLVDLSVRLDVAEAAATDDLAATVDSEELEALVLDAARAGFRLVEALAQAIADRCLALPRVQAVRVTVEKPGALPHTRAVAVELERSKP